MHEAVYDLKRLLWRDYLKNVKHTVVHMEYDIFMLSQLLLTQDMVSVSAQIARGMYHLSKKGGIVHKDLAARNI